MCIRDRTVTWSGASVTNGATRYYKIKSKGTNSGTLSSLSTNYGTGYRSDTINTSGYTVKQSTSAGGAYSQIASYQSSGYNWTGAPAPTYNKPTGEAASDGTSPTAITVSWTANGTIDNGATRYYKIKSKGTNSSTLSDLSSSYGTGYRYDVFSTHQIERAPDVAGSPGTFAWIADDAVTPYSDTPLAGDTTFWYRMRTKSINSVYSDYTSNFSGYTSASGPSNIEKIYDIDASTIEKILGVDYASITSINGIT